jgi:hypothetical protein
MSRRPRIVGFIDSRSGEWRELVDADAKPCLRQLRRLNREGCLELVPPAIAKPVSKSEAS